jgi:50S ribosomal protein L16 3-hydroxylase
MASINLLKGISIKKFFDEYWEKKPLIIRGVLPNASSFMSVSLMKEMAYEQEIESRFLFQSNERQWSIFHNPITEELLEKHKSEKWTLINHATNLFHHPMYELQKSCHFIAQWNFDDIMVSYSMPGGNVGPHIDSYNVFIIQGRGQKKWMINTQPDTKIVPDQELKMLSNFKTESEYILNEGDMIYIPPHVAHYGIALTEGMSYSLGFNSLKPANFSDILYKNMQKHFDDDQILELPFSHNINSLNKYELSPEIHDLLIEQFQKIMTKQRMEEELSQMLTTPRYWPETNAPIPFEEFLSLLKIQPLYRDPYIRFNTLREMLIINGEIYKELHPTTIKQIITILDNFPMKQLPLPNQLNYQTYQILFEIYLKGILFFTE